MPHAIIGASCGLILTGSDVVHHPGIIGLALVGSLLPDIDHGGSTIGRMVKPVSWVVCRFLEHRGPTHSILVMMLVSLATGMALGSEAAGWAVGLGYLSHLITDSMTLAGVHLLWPNPYLFRLRLFRSGSLWEWPIAFGLLALCIRVIEPGVMG